MAKTQPAKPAPAKQLTRADRRKLTDAVRDKGNPTDKMKVRATELGFFRMNRKRKGDVFVIYRHEFSAQWMEVVPNETKLRTQTTADVIAQRDAEIRAQKGPSILGPNAVDELREGEAETDAAEDIEI